MRLSPICTNIPRTLVAGDSAVFTVDDPDHTSDLWTLQLVIGTPTPTLIDADPVEDGTFQITIDPTTSGAISPGQYSIGLVFSKDPDQRATIQGPFLFVLPNPLSPLTQTWEMQTLVVVQTAIAKIGKSSNAQVTINGESYTKANLDGLMDLRDRLINTVANQLRAMRRPTGGVGPRKVVTRFKF